jgi:hypothetical protein
MLGHALRKRRDQSSGDEVVVDIGTDAQGDADVDRGLQRLAGGEAPGARGAR